MITKVSVTLTPRLGKIAPEVVVAVPGYSVHETLWKTKSIKLEFNSDPGWLEINFMNKPDNDPDMAVIIDEIGFFGIASPKFVWAGTYQPKYPEPWYSQQPVTPSPILTNQHYMGWNGTWRLDFSIPVFTWMHRTLGLGWIYN